MDKFLEFKKGGWKVQNVLRVRTEEIETIEYKLKRLKKVCETLDNSSIDELNEAVFNLKVGDDKKILTLEDSLLIEKQILQKELTEIIKGEVAKKKKIFYRFRGREVFHYDDEVPNFTQLATWLRSAFEINIDKQVPLMKEIFWKEQNKEWKPLFEVRHERSQV